MNTTIIQQHHGSDNLEELFCEIRNANLIVATAKVTNSIFPCQRSEALISFIRGPKANDDTWEQFNVSELGCLKQKRVPFVQANKSKKDCQYK